MEEREPEDLRLPRLHWAARHDYPRAAREPDEAARETLLYFVEQGHLHVSISHPSHAQLEAAAGDLLILPPRTIRSQQVGRGTRLWTVFFAGCRFRFNDSPRLLRLSPGDPAAGWMRDLALLRAQNSAQREITDHLLAALLARLQQMEQRHAALKSLHPSVAATVQWIDANLAQSTSLEELAARSHCSPSHLRALFKKQVGSGVLRYQQDRRMQHALGLLNQPHLSLAEVAHRCGYRDAEYFSRLFRRYHGAPPGQVRRGSRQ